MWILRTVIALMLATAAACTTVRDTATPDTVQETQSPVPSELQSAIDATREAVRRWNTKDLVQAGSRFASIPKSHSHEVFFNALWSGTAWFHALLSLNDNRQNPEQVQSFHERAVEALNTALQLRPEDSNAHAMLAVLYGMKIKREPLAMFRLGPQVLGHKKAAEADRTTNPRVAYLEGVSLLRRSPEDATPPNRAIELLLEAEALFGREQAAGFPAWQPAWGRSHNRLFLAEAYEKSGNLEQARYWFGKTLEEAPWLNRASEGYQRCSN